MALLMIVIYYQAKTIIGFWCRQGLNLKSFIQPSETSSIELTGTYHHTYTFRLD